uniref:Uncharacterized protein n=1 Tax=Ditylenchus dipsaci TaxID=166011 RepID=A0A915DZT0_9BILA
MACTNKVGCATRSKSAQIRGRSHSIPATISRTHLDLPRDAIRPVGEQKGPKKVSIPSIFTMQIFKLRQNEKSKKSLQWELDGCKAAECPLKELLVFWAVLGVSCKLLDGRVNKKRCRTLLMIYCWIVIAVQAVYAVWSLAIWLKSKENSNTAAISTPQLLLAPPSGSKPALSSDFPATCLFTLIRGGLWCRLLKYYCMGTACCSVVSCAALFVVTSFAVAREARCLAKDVQSFPQTNQPMDQLIFRFQSVIRSVDMLNRRFSMPILILLLLVFTCALMLIKRQIDISKIHIGFTTSLHWVWEMQVNTLVCVLLVVSIAALFYMMFLFQTAAYKISDISQICTTSSEAVCLLFLFTTQQQNGFSLGEISQFYAPASGRFQKSGHYYSQLYSSLIEFVGMSWLWCLFLWNQLYLIDASVMLNRQTRGTWDIRAEKSDYTILSNERAVIPRFKRATVQATKATKEWFSKIEQSNRKPEAHHGSQRRKQKDEAEEEEQNEVQFRSLKGFIYYGD